MKKIIVILSLTFFTLTSFSQEKEDTIHIRIGNKNVFVYSNSSSLSEIYRGGRNKNFDSHWANIGMGFNTYLNSDYTTGLSAENDFLSLNTSKSWAYQFDPFEQSFNIYKGRIGLVTGLGLRMLNYHFSSNVKLLSDSTSLYYEDILNSEFKKNSLSVTYLTIPLVLEFKLPQKVWFEIGIVGGLKIASKTKQVYFVEGKKTKQKIKDDYHLNPFNYGLTARLGYDDFAIYTNIDMSTMFEKNKGPVLYPFTLGVCLFLN